jgi:chromosomal replication initiation ATPase DnaA
VEAVMGWIEHYKEVKRRILMAAFQPKEKPESEKTNEDRWAEYEKSVSEYLSQYKPTPESSFGILCDVAKRHGMTVAEMKSASRKRRFVFARQEAMYLLRMKGLSFSVIAKLVGVGDHTTALHGVNQHKKRLAKQMLGEASQGG